MTTRPLALPAEPARFDAVLYPNRSLAAPGFYVLMAAIVVISTLIGAGFMLAGAWPVTGFLGLDILLLYLAFRWNYRAARRTECIRLDRDGLVVRRIEPGGQVREWHFEPYWVKVSLDGAPGQDGHLMLSSHGRRLVLGSFLSVGERVEVAEALRTALEAHRRGGHPVPAPCVPCAPISASP